MQMDCSLLQGLAVLTVETGSFPGRVVSSLYSSFDNRILDDDRQAEVGQYCSSGSGNQQ